MTNTPEGPLAGLRAIELASNFAVPGAGMYLADYGADVVKVELPDGDPARAFPPRVTGTDIGKPFLAISRGKRSAVIDWQQPEGLRAVERLLATADIVLVDHPVGAAAATWPFAYERLYALNPRLVYGALTPFGERGQYSRLPGYDPLVQALSGMMVASPDQHGNPTPASFPTSVAGASMVLAEGVMMALLARMRSGRGQRVDTSQLAITMALQSLQLTRNDDDPTPAAEAGLATYNHYTCSDGRVINVSALTSGQWVGLCQVLGLEYLLDDPEYGRNPPRGDQRVTVYPLMEGIFGTRPSDEWLSLLDEAEVPCGPMSSRSELFDDPQVVLNDGVAEIEHAQLGRVQVLGAPVVFSDTPVRPGNRVPALGEHTEQVLTEAGFSAAEISGLRARGIIR